MWRVLEIVVLYVVCVFGSTRRKKASFHEGEEEKKKSSEISFEIHNMSLDQYDFNSGVNSLAPSSNNTSMSQLSLKPTAPRNPPAPLYKGPRGRVQGPMRYGRRGDLGSPDFIDGDIVVNGDRFGSPSSFGSPDNGHDLGNLETYFRNRKGKSPGGSEKERRNEIFPSPPASGAFPNAQRSFARARKGRGKRSSGRVELGRKSYGERMGDLNCMRGKEVFLKHGAEAVGGGIGPGPNVLSKREREMLALKKEEKSIYTNYSGFKPNTFRQPTPPKTKKREQDVKRAYQYGSYNRRFRKNSIDSDVSMDSVSLLQRITRGDHKIDAHSLIEKRKKRIEDREKRRAEAQKKKAVKEDVEEVREKKVNCYLDDARAAMRRAEDVLNLGLDSKYIPKVRYTSLNPVATCSRTDKVKTRKWSPITNRRSLKRARLPDPDDPEYNKSPRKPRHTGSTPPFRLKQALSRVSPPRVTMSLEQITNMHNDPLLPPLKAGLKSKVHDKEIVDAVIKLRDLIKSIQVTVLNKRAYLNALPTIQVVKLCCENILMLLQKEIEWEGGLSVFLYEMKERRNDLDVALDVAINASRQLVESRNAFATYSQKANSQSAAVPELQTTKLKKLRRMLVRVDKLIVELEKSEQIGFCFGVRLRKKMKPRIRINKKRITPIKTTREMESEDANGCTARLESDSREENLDEHKQSSIPISGGSSRASSRPSSVKTRIDLPIPVGDWSNVPEEPINRMMGMFSGEGENSPSHQLNDLNSLEQCDLFRAEINQKRMEDVDSNVDSNTMYHDIRNDESYVDDFEDDDDAKSDENVGTVGSQSLSSSSSSSSSDSTASDISNGEVEFFDKVDDFSTPKSNHVRNVSETKF